MLNQLVIVGRFNGWKSKNVFLVTIISPKSKGTPKDEDISFDVPFVCSDSLLENINSTVKEQDLVGVKGFFDLNSNNHIVLYADRISFLSSHVDEKESN